MANKDVSLWHQAMNGIVGSDEPGIHLPYLTLKTVIGIAVAVVGNVLISLALNLQKLAHLRLAKERKRARMERELHVSGDRRYSRSPHDRTPSEDPATGSHELETQPLIQDSSTNVPRARYGASASVGTRRDDSRSRKSIASTRGRILGKPQRKPNFASRFLPFCIGHGIKGDHGNISHTQEVSAIPVDVIPAEHLVTLNGNRSHKCPSPEVWEDEGTESDYLRSKLWYVFLHWMVITLSLKYVSGGLDSF